jgi:hypothetical protein
MRSVPFLEGRRRCGTGEDRGPPGLTRGGSMRTSAVRRSSTPSTTTVLRRSGDRSGGARRAARRHASGRRGRYEPTRLFTEEGSVGPGKTEGRRGRRADGRWGPPRSDCSSAAATATAPVAPAPAAAERGRRHGGTPPAAGQFRTDPSLHGRGRRGTREQRGSPGRNMGRRGGSPRSLLALKRRRPRIAPRPSLNPGADRPVSRGR